jgi:hypothetical protein
MRGCCFTVLAEAPSVKTRVFGVYLGRPGFPMDTRITLTAHLRYLAATDGAAFLIIVLLLFGASRIRILLSPLAVLALSLLTAAGFGAHVWLWLRRGIHAVEVDDDSITVYRGSARAAQRLERGAIESIRVVNRLGWRAIVVHPRSGRGIRIGEDAFPREDFLKACGVLGAWK